MLMFIGILIILVGIASFVLPLFLDLGPNSFLVKMKTKVKLIIFAVGILFMFFSKSLMYSVPGHQYFVVDPFGNKSAIMSEGYKFIFPFSSISEWTKYIDIKVVSEKDVKRNKIDLSLIEGVMDPTGIRFIDQVTGDVYISTRFKLPSTEKDFIDIAIKYRSERNLIDNTLIPTIRENIVNTGYMFAAQDYISGESQKFRSTLDEQLKYGTYAVNKIETRDTVYSESDKEKSREIKEIQTKYTVEKQLGKDGRPIRIPHELTENNITVSQVIVDAVDLNKTFKKRLEAQRDESAKRQLEQQKIETAKAAQSRIIAEGERDKAAERVNQEKEQVKALIAIETQLKQEETKRQLAEIALKTQQLDAKRVIVDAEAQARKNRLLVQAGLTPQERAEWNYKTSVEVAKQMKDLKLPTVMANGGGEGSSSLEGLLKVVLGKELQEKMKK